jgi:cobalt-zinc-cadmium efflux system membrane fusion protein
VGTVGVACVVVGAIGAVVAHQATPPVPPVHDEDAMRVDGTAIVLTGHLRAQLGVRTAVARRAALSPIVATTGTVTFDPRYTAAIGTRIPGIVRSVMHYEGDTVAAGESLAVLEGAELGAAQAEVLAVRAHLDAAGRSYEREQGLGAHGLSSTRRVEAAAARFTVLQSKRVAAEQRVSALGGEVVNMPGPGVFGVHRLHSPIAGTIVERYLHNGESVEDHRVAFRITNLDHLWVELSLVESIRSVKVGDAVEVCAAANPDECVTGTVAHMGEEVDPSTLTVPVRIEVDNRARRLRAGQSVSAKIRASGSTADGVVIPLSAITHVDGQPMVFVESPNRNLQPTNVVLAESNEQDQRIASGVDVGQTVVSEGTGALTSALFR